MFRTDTIETMGMDDGAGIPCDDGDKNNMNDSETDQNQMDLPQSQPPELECPYPDNDSCPCVGTEYSHEKSEVMAATNVEGWKTMGTGIHKGMLY